MLFEDSKNVVEAYIDARKPKYLPDDRGLVFRLYSCEVFNEILAGVRRNVNG